MGARVGRPRVDGAPQRFDRLLVLAEVDAGGPEEPEQLGVRRGGLLLSVLVAPLYSPTLILGAVCARAATLQIDPVDALLLLAAISLGTIALAPFAAAAALRINLS